MDQTIILLDDNRDMLESLREVVELVSGRECLVATSYAELVQLGDRALACATAVLDINLRPGEPNGIDAYEWLKRSGFQGKIVFLTGHAREHPLVAQACELGRTEVIQKPASVEQLMQAMGL
jgi:FixJ family two-component response regulator